MYKNWLLKQIVILSVCECTAAEAPYNISKGIA